MSDASPNATPQSFIRRRPMVVAAIIVLLVVVVVGAGIVIVANPFAKNAPTTGEQTIWQAITGKIRDGQPSKEVALQAFAYAYDIDIPGVQVPNAADGSDVPEEGTLVTQWVQARWDELTPEQQAVISPYLQPGPNDTVIDIDLASGSSTIRSRGIASTRALKVGPSEYQDAPSDALQAAFKNELLADIAHIGQRLGLPTISEGFSLWTKVTLTLSEEDGGNTLFTTNGAENRAGVWSPCNVTAWHNAWAGEQPNGSTLSDRLHVLVTHEVVHCYQNTIWGGIAVANSIPAWITEGTALWLAADDTQLLESMVPSQWRDGYFAYPERPLTVRTYDAYGYFALLSHMGRSLWSQLVPAWQAAAAATTPGGNSSNAFIGMLDGDGTDVRNAWAPSYLREDGWGDPWIAYGFGLPDDARTIRHSIGAYRDPGFLGELDSRSNVVNEVQESAGEIVLVQTDGIASVRDNAGHSKFAFQSVKFCVQGNCICPTDTQRAGQKMTDEDITLPFVLAINAPSGGAKYRVVGRKLRDECGERRQDTPFPPPRAGGNPPCGAGCAGSNGDPHLRTVNNVYYDFQAAGEFTLLRSADGTLDIQARQEPYDGSDSVSINTAVVALNNGHRVGVYFSGYALVARVDGSVIDASTPLDLGNGARIAEYERGFQIDFPDGTQLWALSVGEWGIEAQIRPSEGLRGDGVGILGPIVPGGLAVPKLPDGTSLPPATDDNNEFQMIYGTFADAWRVTAASSLFDYDAGKSTASYTNTAFPAQESVLTPADLTDEQRAQAAIPCADITDLGLLEQCLFDVSVTGNDGFADVYRMVGDLVTLGPVTLGVPIEGGPEPSPGVTPTPGPTGTLTPTPANALLPGLESLRGSALGPDGTLYMSIAYPDDQYQLVAVDPVDGRVVAEVDAQGGGQVAVAAGSVWAGEFTGSADCSITRLDASTLAVQTTIATPCELFGTSFASTGDAVWYLDRELAEYTQEGVRRIDPQTNIAGDPVVLPFFNGYLYGTTSGLIYGENSNGWYRLPVGQTELQSLGVRRVPVHPGGAGIWNQNELVAEFFTQEGPPTQSIQIDGALISADDQAVYVDALGLWRYPISGADPVLVATAPEQYGDRVFYYFDNDPLLVSPGGLVKIWMTYPTPTSESFIYVQWIPTL